MRALTTSAIGPSRVRQDSTTARSGPSGLIGVPPAHRLGSPSLLVFACAWTSLIPQYAGLDLAPASESHGLIPSSPRMSSKLRARLLQQERQDGYLVATTVLFNNVCFMLSSPSFALSLMRPSLKFRGALGRSGEKATSNAGGQGRTFSTLKPTMRSVALSAVLEVVSLHARAS